MIDVTEPQTLISPAEETWKQVGQNPLSNQLRENPRSPWREPAKFFAGVSARDGFYLGRRNKSLAFSSACSIRRGVFGRRCDTPQNQMRANTEREPTTGDCEPAVTSTDEKLFFSRRERTTESAPLHKNSKNTIQRCCCCAVCDRGAGGVACHPTHPTQGSVGSEGGLTTLRPKTSLGGWSWRWSS